jgi:hypothetical protein
MVVLRETLSKTAVVVGMDAEWDRACHGVFVVLRRVAERKRQVDRACIVLDADTGHDRGHLPRVKVVTGFDLPAASQPVASSEAPAAATCWTMVRPIPRAEPAVMSARCESSDVTLPCFPVLRVRRIHACLRLNALTLAGDVSTDPSAHAASAGSIPIAPPVLPSGAAGHIVCALRPEQGEDQ